MAPIFPSTPTHTSTTIDDMELKKVSGDTSSDLQAQECLKDRDKHENNKREDSC